MKKNEKETFQELEDWFEENNEFEAMETMTEILKVQQQTSLELTRLVLEHCKDEKRTKESVFNIYKDASKLIMTQMTQ